MKKFLFIIAGFLMLAALTIAYVELRSEVLVIVRILLYASVILILLVSFGFAFFWGWDIREKLLMRQANRQMAQRESEVYHIVADEGQQIFIRDLNRDASWRNATIDARIVANGRYHQPDESEVRLWQQYQQFRSKPSIVKATEQQMLPAQTHAHADLMGALDSVQRCLIVGASDSGKTTLMQWLVSRRLNTSRVIVIDPHAYPSKWPSGADVIGLGRDYPKIEQALNALVELMTRRYDEIGRGLVAEMAHSKITIIIDEWRAITGNLGKSAETAIKTLLTESRKAAFSVFVASHSERAKPLGLEGEYDLKDGFTIVRLSVVSGQRQATIDSGNGEMPAALPGPFSSHNPQVFEHDSGSGIDFDLDLEPKPTPAEPHVLELLNRGESLKTITEAVWGPGKFGGFYNDKVEEIRQKWG